MIPNCSIFFFFILEQRFVAPVASDLQFVPPNNFWPLLFSRPRNASVFTLQRICDGLEDPVSGTAWGLPIQKELKKPLESISNWQVEFFTRQAICSDYTIVIHKMLTKEAFLISQVTSHKSNHSVLLQKGIEISESSEGSCGRRLVF